MRFRLRMEGKLKTIHGPTRSTRGAAEADRRYVAACSKQAPRSSRSGRPSRFDVAARAMLNLRNTDEALPLDAPCSASTLNVEVHDLPNMNQKELRALAMQLPEMRVDKKTARG